MTDDSKEQMMQQFQQYLDETANQKRSQEENAKQELLHHFQSFLQDDIEMYQTSPERAPDLFTLLAQQTALKNEVKLESRQFKNALDKFNETVDLLKQNNQHLTAQIVQQEQQYLEETTRLERHFLLDLIELRDRLFAGFEQTKDYPAGFFAKKSKQQFIDTVSQGMSMNIERLDKILKKHAVIAIDTIGQSFNPDIMRATALEYHPEHPEGIVIAEQQTGFMYKNELLRIADVIVNKRKQENE